MISFLLTTAAIGSLLWALRLWNKRKKHGDHKSEQLTGGEEQGKSEPLKNPQRRVNTSEPREHAQLRQIAEKVQFSTALLVSQVKVGERLVSVQYPADEVSVRPMASIGELTRALPETWLLDDMSYFAKVARRDIPVIEHLEREGIFEDRFGEPNNGLVYLEDVSPSMRAHQRMRWALKLADFVLRRAEAGKAKTFLIPFGGALGDVSVARTFEEYASLRRNLTSVFEYIDSTDISRALEAGMDILESEAFTSRKILLVTDGDDGINVEGTRRRLKELGVELHTVCIGKDNRGLRDVSHSYDLFRDSD